VAISLAEGVFVRGTPSLPFSSVWQRKSSVVAYLFWWNNKKFYQWPTLRNLLLLIFFVQMAFSFFVGELRRVWIL